MVVSGKGSSYRNTSGKVGCSVLATIYDKFLITIKYISGLVNVFCRVNIKYVILLQGSLMSTEYNVLIDIPVAGRMG